MFKHAQFLSKCIQQDKKTVINCFSAFIPLFCLLQYQKSKYNVAKRFAFQPPYCTKMSNQKWCESNLH